jgi:hypothetical protein
MVTWDGWHHYASIEYKFFRLDVTCPDMSFSPNENLGAGDLVFSNNIL